MSIATGEVTEALVSSFEVVVMVDAPIDLQVCSKDGIWVIEKNRGLLYCLRILSCTALLIVQFIH